VIGIVQWKQDALSCGAEERCPGAGWQLEPSSRVLTCTWRFAFVVAKIKDLAPQEQRNRTANGTTELVLHQNGLDLFPCQGAGRRSEGPIALKAVLRFVLPKLAVNLIAAALDADVEDGAGSRGHTRAIVVRRHTDSPMASAKAEWPGSRSSGSTCRRRCCPGRRAKVVETRLRCPFTLYEASAAGHCLVFKVVWHERQA